MTAPIGDRARAIPVPFPFPLLGLGRLGASGSNDFERRRCLDKPKAAGAPIRPSGSGAKPGAVP